MRDFHLQELQQGNVIMSSWEDKTMMYVKQRETQRVKPAHAAMQYMMNDNPNGKRRPLRAIAA